MNTIIIKITLVRSGINLLKRDNRLLWMCNSVKTPYDNIEAKYFHEQAITPLMPLPLAKYVMVDIFFFTKLTHASKYSSSATAVFL